MCGVRVVGAGTKNVVFRGLELGSLPKRKSRLPVEPKALVHIQR